MTIGWEIGFGFQPVAANGEVATLTARKNEKSSPYEMHEED